MADPYDTLLPILDLQLDRGGRASAYDDDRRTAAIDVALGAFETEANAAFFPRETTATILVEDGLLILDDCDLTAVASISGPDGDIAPATVTIADDQILGTGRWPMGIYTVTYTHGLATCPPDVARAVAVLASSLLADGPWDDRGYGVVDEGGFARLLTAGVSGASFSIPEVQAALHRHRNPTIA